MAEASWEQGLQRWEAAVGQYTNVTLLEGLPIVVPHMWDQTCEEWALFPEGLKVCG